MGEGTKAARAFQTVFEMKVGQRVKAMESIVNQEPRWRCGQVVHLEPKMAQVIFDGSGGEIQRMYPFDLFPVTE